MSRCTDPAGTPRTPGPAGTPRTPGLLPFAWLLPCALPCLLGGCAEAPLVVPEVPMVPISIAPCTPIAERIEHLDQPSALGFSAVELLAKVAGDSVSPLFWLPPQRNSAYLLAYGPESGRSSLRLRVTPAEGEVFYRYEIQALGAPEGTECAEPVLDVPVTVSLSSEAGALDETFPARLQASAVYRATFTHQLFAGHTDGGFAFTDLTSLDPERTFSAGPITLQAVLWEGGSQGSLRTELQSYYTERASPALREAWPGPMPAGEATYLAEWPSAEPCGAEGMSRLPIDAQVLGFSVQDVLSALGRAGARELVWSTGEVTALELDFVPPASELCQGLDGELTFEASVRVRTADGRLSSELPVQINAENAGGAIGEISVTTPEQAPTPSAEPHVELEASFRSALSSGALTFSGAGGKSGRWTR